MLYEFAITPDVFRPDVVNADPVLGLTLVQLLRGLCDNGLVANLHKDRWIRHIMNNNVATLSPALRDTIITCLNVLHDRHRLVRHPRRLQGDPASDHEWLDLALESHRRIAFYGIVLSQLLLKTCGHTDGAFIELSTALDAPQWCNRRRSRSLTKCEADYRIALAPFLRHARSVLLIDPYMSCHESRYFDTIRLCLELTGQRGYDPQPARIHIHAGDPQADYAHQELVPDRLFAWEHKLRSLRPLHRITVFLWSARPGGETFHDRYILTDQCGISVPAGLDYRTSSVPNSTTWSLLDEEDRIRRFQDFDPSTSPYQLLGKCEM